MFKQKFVKLSGERLSQKQGDGADDRRDHRADRPLRLLPVLERRCWSACVTWLAFAWIGVRYAGLWGVAAGVLNCIPYFGPTHHHGRHRRPPRCCSSGSLVDGGAGRAARRWRSPRSKDSCWRRSRSAARRSVNSVAVFVAVMFWGWMWGSLGLILAVPILMIVKTVADHVESLSSLSELLGDRIDASHRAHPLHVALMHGRLQNGRYVHTYRTRTDLHRACLPPTSAVPSGC